MKDSNQDIRDHNHNDTDSGEVERRKTWQSAARSGRAPQDKAERRETRQSAVRQALHKPQGLDAEYGNDVTTKKTVRLNEGKQVQCQWYEILI